MGFSLDSLEVDGLLLFLGGRGGGVLERSFSVVFGGGLYGL